ncbi:MAG TPA: lysylphosphatidylglycerol synthase transmembrane domain-containing protein, partial [Candidatus Caenarcaniphilales bacterium]
MRSRSLSDIMPRASGPRRVSNTKYYQLLVGLAIAAVFLYLTFGRLEWRSIQSALGAAMPGPLLFAFVFLAAGFFTRITRWWWMLRIFEPRLPLSNCIRPFLVSLAVNNTVPFRAGDLLRTVGFRDELRSPPMRVLGTLVIERLLDLLVLLAFFFIGFIGLSSVAANRFPPLFINATIAIAAICLIGLLMLLLLPNQVQQVFRWLSDRGWLGKHKTMIRAQAWLLQLFDALLLLRSPKLSFQLLALTILAWTFEGGVFGAVAWSLQADSALLGPWFSLALGTLATLVPSSPGYVGTFDYFAMLGLISYGSNREVAAVFALLIHLLLWAPVTLIGAVLLATLQRRRKPLSDYEPEPSISPLNHRINCEGHPHIVV